MSRAGCNRAELTTAVSLDMSTITRSVALLLALLLPTPPAGAKTTATTSPGNWTAAIWGNGSPSNADVVVLNHNVILTNATPELTALTNAATLTFSGSNAVVTARVVYCSGTLTHDLNSDTNAADGWQIDNGARITCSNFTLTGTVNLEANGFQNGAGFNLPGKGPGGGQIGGGGGGGGGYGGSGGGGGNAGGTVYGSPSDPQWPGSGGANRDQHPGGHGGGFFSLEADGHVVINGTINADGGHTANVYGGGGGSGGGVNIRCATLAATNGSITAVGGNGGEFRSGSGGGGRVAISIADAAAQSTLAPPQLLIDTRRGPESGPNNAPNLYLGDFGTLFIDHDDLLTPVVTGRYAHLHGPVASSLMRSSLSLTNSWLSLSSNVDTRIGGDLRLWDASLLGLHDTVVGGDIVLASNSTVSFSAGPTNGASPTWGSMVTVTGDIAIASNCAVQVFSDPTNGGSVFLRVDNILIADGGVLTADEAGFAGGNPDGYGPGYGAGEFGGGGHGGTGGRHPTHGGATYGSITNPAHAGSGGAGRGAATGKRGGGLIHVTASNAIAIHGTITANGGGSTANNICGGAGGGIYLWADVFPLATGAIRADGGSGFGDYGAGGGGRIARYYRSDGFAGTITADGGTGGNYPGADGTVHADFNDEYVTFTVEGSPARRGAPAPYGYGDNGVLTGAVINCSVNSPADEGGGVRYHCVGWTLTNDLGALSSGTGTQKLVNVTTNTTLTWLWTNVYHLTAQAGAGGTLALDVSGWYTNGVTIEVTPVPDAGHRFSQWQGDYHPASWTSSSLVVTMDAPRTVTAVFGVNGGTPKTWVGGTGIWTDGARWIPPGVPAADDSAIVAAGTVAMDEPVRVASVTLLDTAVLTLGNGVDLYMPGDLIVSGAAAAVTLDAGTLSVGGDIRLAGGADLYVNAGATNETTGEHGAQVEARRAMTLATGSWVYPQSDATNGGSACFRVRTLRVADGGGFDADGRGFRGGQADLDPGGPSPGWGYGRGNLGDGAGHGGRGGRYETPPYGTTYGLAEAPVHPGSGGGGLGGGGNIRRGGNGGGLVRIDVANTVTLDGIMTANGDPGSGGYGSGGGSGGAIYVQCVTLKGNGLLSADAGAGHPNNGTSGGGGRIAVWRTAHYFTGTATADRSTPATTPDAEPGTIYWGFIPATGAVLILR